MNIGFIGLGNMGSGMAANLLKAGYHLIVNDLRHETVESLLKIGAEWADTPKDLASRSEIVFTSLPGPAEIKTVALGENGILEGSKPDSVYIDLSTGDPTVVRKIHAAFADKGVHMLDAPVSGATIGARTGRLAVIVGGEREVYERCKPVLGAIGDHVDYAGEIGCGTVCKLSHNCLSYGLQMIAAECYTLGVKAGAEPAALAEFIHYGGVGRAVHFDFIYPETYLQGKFDPPQFTLKGALKDVGLALQMAREYQVPMAVGNLAYQELTAAMNRGWGEEDSRKAMLLQEERAGDVRVRVNKE